MEWCWFCKALHWRVAKVSFASLIGRNGDCRRQEIRVTGSYEADSQRVRNELDLETHLERGRRRAVRVGGG